MDLVQAASPVTLSILLPVIGKGMNLSALLKIVTLDIAVPYEVLVVHDGSADQAAMLDGLKGRCPSLIPVQRQGGSGTLSAVRSGINQAQGKYILLICADSVGPVLGINQMIDMMEEGFDFISGTRYACGGRRLGGSVAWLSLSRMANSLLRSLAGCGFSDATTGLKLFRKDVFEKLNAQTDSEGWVLAFEMALKAQKAGLKLGEVANISIDRLCGGYSTYHVEREFFHYLGWFIWAIAKLRPSKVPPIQVRPLQVTSI